MTSIAESKRRACTHEAVVFEVRRAALLRDVRRARRLDCLHALRVQRVLERDLTRSLIDGGAYVFSSPIPPVDEEGRAQRAVVGLELPRSADDMELTAVELERELVARNDRCGVTTRRGRRKRKP